MSANRLTTWVVLAFWGTSMAWLGYHHLALLPSQMEAPRPQEVLPVETGELKPIRWKLLLDDQPIGWAVHRVRRQDDGYGEIASTVRIEKLSIEHVLRQGIGSLGSLVLRGASKEEISLPESVSITVENQVRFDEYAQLQGFTCKVREDLWGECVHLQGDVDGDDQIQVKAFLTLNERPDEPLGKPLYKTTLRLPDDRSVMDSLAPNPQLRGLRLGQRWSLQTYRPLFPTSPLQLVEAYVASRELVRVGDDVYPTMHVVYERSAQEPLSWERRLGDAWVLDDGTVIRQSLSWGKFTLTFEREFDAPTDAE